MTHRDVRVSLYGVVAGVLLGAGVLAYAQQGSFLGSTVAILRSEVGAPSRGDYTQRNVAKRGVPLRDDTIKNAYPTIKGATGESSSPTGAVDTSPAICTAVRNAVAKIERVYNMYIPNTLKNTEIREKMDSVIAEATAAECPNETGASSPAAATNSPAATVDNDCEKFPAHTTRYTQCVLAEKNGKKYP